MVKRVFVVAGARPNFVKIAPFINQLKVNNIEYKLIHTGQHYDYNMSNIFFDNLNIPEPDIHLNVGSASHATQTAKIMIEFEKIIEKERPILVVVVGDVNSTLACALVAKKLNIKIAHIEAGLRSFDQKMPEEINRLLTDQISNFLFASEKKAIINLKKEGIHPNKIFFVGNIMIDTLKLNIKKSQAIQYYEELGLEKKNYALITVHRPSNVDNYNNLEKIVEIINYLQNFTMVFFPIHPRTKKNLDKFDLKKKINRDNLLLSDPVGYLEFLNLMENSRLILTDSGGIQEEASYLRVPVLTLRKNTERPITIEKGTNTLVNLNVELIKKLINDIFSNNYKKGENIEKWDGNTAKEIVKILKQKIFDINKNT